MSTKPPVHIRDTIQSYGDPYINEESLADYTICKNCGSMYMSSRWYTKDQVQAKRLGPDEVKHHTLCPACQKLRDRVPGGVLKMSGSFIWTHRDDILNLIRNEGNNALADNPLERVMSMEVLDEEVHISTTNERLAERLGRALHKAYRGEIEYKWSDNDKLARINWHRDD